MANFIQLINPFSKYCTNTRVTVPLQLNDGVIRVKYYYSGGSGGINGHAKMAEKFAFNNNGQFILITRGHNNNGNLDQNFYNELRDSLNSQGYNITGFEVDTYSGVSSGSQTAATDFLKALSENKDNKPLHLTLYDPTVANPGNLPFYPKDDDLIKMRETNSCFRLITFHTFEKNKGRIDAWLSSSGVKKVAAAGINTIVVSGNYTGGNGHEECYGLAVKHGWEDFFDGTIELNDIKNECDGYNYDYKINIPNIDENGKVTWKEYRLEELQNQYTNFFSLSDEDQAIFLKTMKYIEGTRVKVDFDYLSGISDVVNSANTLSNACDNDASISYTSTSTLLAEENRLIKKVFDRTSDLITNLNKTTTAVNDAKYDYTYLEKRLNDSLKNLNEKI